MSRDSLDNQMSTLNISVGNDPVVVLRDTGWSGIVIKRNLVKEEQSTGKIGYVITVGCTY